MSVREKKYVKVCGSEVSACDDCSDSSPFECPNSTFKEIIEPLYSEYSAENPSRQDVSGAELWEL